MLNINMEGSRAYAQHQHGRLQGLCPTHPIIFSCVLELLAQHKGMYSRSRASRSTQIINHSSDPKLLSQDKTSRQSFSSRSTPNTNKHIDISSIIGLCPICKTNHHVHMQWGLQPNIKIKHPDNHHNQ